MKIAKLFILFFIINVFCSFCYGSSICLTGSSVKILKEYGDSFFNGALFALNKSRLKKHKIKIKKFFYDRSPLAAISETKKMLKSDCIAIIGYTNQNDLLSIKSLVENKILIISIYGEVNRKFPKNIISLQASPQKLAKHLFEYLDEKRIKIGRPFLVTSIDKSSFLNYKSAYLSELEKRNIEHVELDILERSFSLKQIKRHIKKKNIKFDTLISLNNSIISAQLADSLPSKNLILGTKNFGSSNSSGFFRRLKDKNIKALFSRQNSLKDKEPRFLNFKNQYVKEFNKQPFLIAAYAYDTVNFLSSVFESISRLNRENILKTFSISKHNGITGIKIIDGTVINRSNPSIISINKLGHKLEEFR